MDQQEANNKVVEPLEQANNEVKRLKELKKKYDVVMQKLVECQEQISHYDGTSKEIEW
jgi:DNA repair ATPase RecN